jgi:acyl-CoA thioesterase FadM
MRMRIPMSDVDGARLIYFAAPAVWSERVMSDWMASELRPTSELFASGAAYPVVSTQSTFHAPLPQDDLVDLVFGTARVGRSSFTVRTEARRLDGTLAVSVETVHVYVESLDGELAPTPLPAWLREPLIRGLLEPVEGP